MKLFSVLYDKVMRWSTHQHAARYLAALSFAESSFFPIPPDVMLAPMSLAKPERAWRYASLTTLMSVAGGMFGYLLGAFAFEYVEPLLRSAGYWESYQHIQSWFNEWGFWAIFIAGFSPIPYKLFTIGAGMINMAFAPFVLASAIGRGARFFMVAGVMRWGGARMEQVLRAYIDRIGWLLVVLVVIAYFIFNSGNG